MSALNPNIVWAKVDVLTAYQRLTAEIQIRGRLRDTINDPAVPLNGVPEGLFNKGAVCGIRTIEPEVPLPDQPEQIRRFVMFQGTTFMITGACEFPKASDPKMHGELLMKSRFFPMVDVTVVIIGAAGKGWTQPAIMVNRDLMLALYLG